MAGLLAGTLLTGYFLLTSGKAGLFLSRVFSEVVGLLGGRNVPDPLNRILIYAGTFVFLCLVGAIVLSFPLSVLFLPFRRKIVDSKPVLRRFSRRHFEQGRRKSGPDAYFAGIDAETGKPVYVSDESRMMHTHILGVTGAAKTEGGIVPALVHDILWGCGAIIIDMKGDKDLLERIAAVVKAAKREKDFYYFGLAKPSWSNTYNPLGRGNPSEQKDKYISSLVWTEEYYKKVAEIALLKVCKSLQALGRPVTFQTLKFLLSDLKRLKDLSAELVKNGLPDDIAELLRVLNNNTQNLAGLLSDLMAVVDSDFGHLFDVAAGEIDLVDVYQKNKIVLFQLNTGLYQETSVRLARLILQDIKTMSNLVQANLSQDERGFFPIFVDEFATIAFPGFIDLLNKARSSKIAITIAHQSLGDLKQYGDYIGSQVNENTNNKLIFRQTDPDSVNLLTQMGGTAAADKLTVQTSQFLGGTVETGVGSSRTVEKFRIDPNLIKELPRGYAVLMQKDINRICYVQCDYMPVKGSLDFLKEREKEQKKEPPVPAIQPISATKNEFEEDEIAKRI